MHFLPEDIDQYAHRFTQEESDLLKKLNRETQIKMVNPRMLSGHLQGRFLSFISHLKQPKHILEIGTYTGYSALCLAEGLPKDGQLTTIDVNEEVAYFAQRFFDESPYKTKINLLVGNACDLIPNLTSTFDLVFIDADKENYKAYFNLIIDRVEPNGFILIDNVLWNGHILKPTDEMDKSTLAIHEFNSMVHNDTRVENVLLPIRDGLMILRKL